MNQSVYKRDFRDPRDMSLWKFFLNGNYKSNIEDNGGGERATGALDELSMKNCLQDHGEEAAKTKSVMIINKDNDKKEEVKNEAKSSKSMPCLGSASKVKFWQFFFLKN